MAAATRRPGPFSRFGLQRHVTMPAHAHSHCEAAAAGALSRGAWPKAWPIQPAGTSSPGGRSLALAIGLPSRAVWSRGYLVCRPSLRPVRSYQMEQIRMAVADRTGLALGRERERREAADKCLSGWCLPPPYGRPSDVSSRCAASNRTTEPGRAGFGPFTTRRSPQDLTPPACPKGK